MKPTKDEIISELLEALKEYYAALPVFYTSRHHWKSTRPDNDGTKWKNVGLLAARAIAKAEGEA